MSEESISSYFLHFPFTSADFLKRNSPSPKDTAASKGFNCSSKQADKTLNLFRGFWWTKKISGKNISSFFLTSLGFVSTFSTLLLASDQVLKSFISTKPSTKCDVPKCRGWGFRSSSPRGNHAENPGKRPPLLTSHFAFVGCEVSWEVTLNFNEVGYWCHTLKKCL